MLVHPTLGHFDRGDDPLLRLRNVETLSKLPGLRPDFAPLDMGSLNFDGWNPETKEFLSDNMVYQNSARDLRLMARRLRELGVKPQLVIYGLSGLSLMNAFIATGAIDPPPFVMFVMGGGGALFGHPATTNGLRAFIDNMGRSDVQWGVMTIGGSYLPMLRPILEAGGHVSIGLGDHPYAELGAPSNAELVRQVVDMAREVGRTVASPEDARLMLGMVAPTLSEQPM
jgi:uncharacterized protein (DUF849 family)